MLNELERKEKEAKNKINESNILNKKRFRYNSPLSQAYQYNNYSQNDNFNSQQIYSNNLSHLQNFLIYLYLVLFLYKKKKILLLGLFQNFQKLPK